MAADEEQGLYEKFTVTRNDGSSEPGGKHEHCEYFVLDLHHDPYALVALRAYEQALGRSGQFPALRADLCTQLGALRLGFKKSYQRLKSMRMEDLV